MTVLGIDPGTAITGYGFIKVTDKTTFQIIDFGVINTPKETDPAKRLLMIHRDLQQLIAQHKPERAGLEKLFFSTNVTTAIGVAQARGVALLSLAEAGLPILEFTPQEVKIAVTGYGAADKMQVQNMIQRTFKLPELPKPDDAADALAIAIAAALVPSYI